MECGKIFWDYENGRGHTYTPPLHKKKNQFTKKVENLFQNFTYSDHRFH